MTKPAAVRRAAAEADRLIAELNAPPGAPPAGTPPVEPAPAPQPAELQLQPGEPAPAVQTGEPAPAPTPTPAPREDWKQKYLVLQGKYDTETARQATQIQTLLERCGSLERLLSNMSAPAAPAAPAAPVPTITEADVEEYGRPMIDFVQRAVTQATAPLLQQLGSANSELASLKKQVGQTTATVEQDAQGRMHTQLDGAVPDWRVINSSPAFVAWLKELDVFSGRQRHELLLEAYGKNDAARVQRFFQAFKQEDSAIEPTAGSQQPHRVPQVDPATLVAPGAPRGGNPGTDAPGGKRIWTQQEIAVFYDQKRRGKIPPAEAAQTERDIIEASAQGRVR